MSVRIPETDFISLSRPLDAVEPRADPLGIEFVFQLESGWCWAACVAMICRKKGKSGKSVEQVVSGYFNKKCYRPPWNPMCFKEVESKMLPELWSSFDVTASELQKAQSDLTAAIETLRSPVQVVYNEIHAALVVGTFRHDDSTTGFIVHDPFQNSPQDLEWNEVEVYESKLKASAFLKLEWSS